MGVYIFKVPVEGFEYYEIEAASVGEASRIMNEDLYIPDEPISSEMNFAGDFELESVLRPGNDDEEF